MYPPLPMLLRTCTEDYLIPDTNLIIKKGTTIVIPIYGLQRDKEHFPEPDMFIPERFSEENVSSIKSYTYLPFGCGPRNCLGI